MTASFTPGPWEVHERTTAHLPWSYYIGHPSETIQVSEEEAEANAQLMSAAPDLLAACKAFLRCPPKLRHDLHLEEIVSAAIARAEQGATP
jgi:hypothetical protein